MGKRSAKNAEEWTKIKREQDKANEKTRQEHEGKPAPGKTSGRLPSGRIPGR